VYPHFLGPPALYFDERLLADALLLPARSVDWEDGSQYRACGAYRTRGEPGIRLIANGWLRIGLFAAGGRVSVSTTVLAPNTRLEAVDSEGMCRGALQETSPGRFEIAVHEPPAAWIQITARPAGMATHHPIAPTPIVMIKEVHQT